MEYDVIIIGAGLGGLTAGAKLAHEGRKVLLIEQRDTPGGCATTFTRKGYRVEVSLHMLDGLDQEDRKVPIFEELQVFDSVEFIRTPEFYRFSNGRCDVVVPFGFEHASRSFSEHFPGERKGIEEFFRSVLRIRKELGRIPRRGLKLLLQAPVLPLLCPNLMFGGGRTLGGFLDQVTANEDLKLALTANASFYHDNPYSLAYLVFAGAQASFYRGGGHFIRGGSQRLSDALARRIISDGGEILLNHVVTGIITENGKAVGVRFKETRTDKRGAETALAAKIVANAAIPNVAGKLLSGEAGRPLRRTVQGLEIGTSLLAVYFGFKKPLRELGNKHYITIVCDETVERLKDLAGNLKGDLGARAFGFCDYSQIDSGLASEGKSTGSVFVVSNRSEWEQPTDGAYRAKKEEAAAILTGRLDTLIPGISSEIEFSEVATPRTIERYTANPLGSVYGFAQTPRQAGRSRICQRSSIENLYFASAWTFPGGGFSGTILAGCLCAEAVLRS